MKSTIIILTVALLFGCNTSKMERDIGLPYYNESTLTPVWEGKASGFHVVPDFSFVDQKGKIVTDVHFKGKIYLANFFFTTCPGICPIMTDNLHAIQDTFSNDPDVLLLSHTVMPWVDDVNQLAEYAKNKDILYEKWKLVTGPKNELYDVARNGYFADEGFGKSVTKETDFLHTENVFLIDQDGHIRGVYNGTKRLEMQRIVEDVKALKAS